MTEQSAAPGWYPTGDGREGYWDGSQWSEFRQPQAPKSGGFKERAAEAAGRLGVGGSTIPPDAVWSAVGKPLSGIGAGRYWLDERHLYFEKGALRTDSQQVPIAQVMDVDVKQSMTQKARGVFTVTVRIQRAGGAIENVLMDEIPGGREAQRIINDAAHAARAKIQQAQNTMRYEGVNPVPTGAPSPAPAAAAAAGDDLIAQISKLADLHAQGILSADEFAAAKQRLINS